MADKERSILLYDGHCLMCSSLVQWVMKRDKKEAIYFGALQDEKVIPLLEKAPPHMKEADSVLLFSGDKFYYRSSAILHLYRLMGFPFSLMVVFFIVPRFIRDFFYKIIAKYRKKWFGSAETCYLVPPEKRSLFITDPSKQYNR